MTAADQALWADLILEGGGVKGIGLVGAAVALTEAGYTVNRVSGDLRRRGRRIDRGGRAHR